MRFKIETKLNDGMSEAPPIEIGISDIPSLLPHIHAELLNDEGRIIGVGATITIERCK